MKIHVGCCGFALGKKKYFQTFSLVEVQSTFYKFPQLKTVQKWRNEAPDDFVFTVKCYQGITHPITSPTWRRSGLKETELEKLREKVGFLKPSKEVFSFWKRTLEICKILQSPICLIQLPSSFKENEENFLNAETFFENIERDDIAIALELRGWSENGFKSLCKKFDLISCVDLFVSKPLWFSRKKIGYFRLHGSYERGRINYKYKYSVSDFKNLEREIKNLKKLKEIFLLWNNIYMKEDALRFLSRII